MPSRLPETERLALLERYGPIERRNARIEARLCVIHEYIYRPFRGADGLLDHGKLNSLAFAVATGKAPAPEPSDQCREMQSKLLEDLGPIQHTPQRAAKQIKSKLEALRLLAFTAWDAQARSKLETPPLIPWYDRDRVRALYVWAREQCLPFLELAPSLSELIPEPWRLLELHPIPDEHTDAVIYRLHALADRLAIEAMPATEQASTVPAQVERVSAQGGTNFGTMVAKKAAVARYFGFSRSGGLVDLLKDFGKIGPGSRDLGRRGVLVELMDARDRDGIAAESRRPREKTEGKMR